MKTEIKLIGQVRSSLKKIEDCPRQGDENAPEAELQIFPEFTEGLNDITTGSEILLLTWLHLADRNVIKCKPRNDPHAPLTGIFSTRSPDRPNPIGIHMVKVLSVLADGLIKVSGLEALDQTPIIDIKPVWNPAEKQL